MKQISKVLLTVFLILSLLLSMQSLAFAASEENTVEPMGISRISVYADRITSTNAQITASGPLTSIADYITTTATLYEYNTVTGALTLANASPVTKTIYDCTTYDFQTNFTVSSSKVYKVKLVVKDYSNGQLNTTTVYSAPF